MSASNNSKMSVSERLTACGQQHLLQHVETLSAEARKAYEAELMQLELEKVNSYFSRTMDAGTGEHEKLDDLMQPIPPNLHGSVSRTPAGEISQYQDIGLKAVSEGKVAVLLLAGGQGTRLGVPYPKGMYDVGLPSGKTLYQIQAERLLCLEERARKQYNKAGEVPWYIMTSEHTKEPTFDFFAKHNYFGLKKDNLVLFEQGMLPCFDFSGKIILEAPGKIARAPDGNGGLYRALRKHNILADMAKRGIQYVHVYCVDNILVKMADPVFVGYCVAKGADTGAKVVEKAAPTEAVGVVCKVGSKYQVVEYSEITLPTAERRNADGRLVFSAGNICNHFFTIEFLNNVVYDCNYEDSMLHHVAKKKIPFCDASGKTVKPDTPNGIKLEKFVFDVFQFSSTLAVWEVVREDEFSPLKNADTADRDTATTCRHSVFALHQRYLLEAGGRLVDAEGKEIPLIPRNKELEDLWRSVVVEISGLVSYGGEGLQALVAGKTFTSPLQISRVKGQPVIHQ